MRQEYLRAAAEAFANITPIESFCYHYLNDGFDTTIQSSIASYYTAALLAGANRPRVKYIDKLVCTALAECQYPINETTGYAWNDADRASFAGIAKQTWSDNKLSDYINFILNDITQNANTVRAEIRLQLLGYSEAS